MKIEIEITEEDAACIWSNNWGEKHGRDMKEILETLVMMEAADFRRNFPNGESDAVAAFRQANATDHPTAP